MNISEVNNWLHMRAPELEERLDMLIKRLDRVLPILDRISQEQGRVCDATRQ